MQATKKANFLLSSQISFLFTSECIECVYLALKLFMLLFSCEQRNGKFTITPISIFYIATSTQLLRDQLFKCMFKYVRVCVWFGRGF